MSIALEQVSKDFRGAAAVSDVTAQIEEGELFVLLGPSGSGKSTLLRAIAGPHPDRPRPHRAARPRRHQPRRADREVGFVFQNYALFRHMTVADNIEFALRARRVRARGPPAPPRRAARLVALEGYDHGCRASYRAASNSASRSRALWLTSRACCCSTSRSARSTRRSARSCGAGSARSNAPSASRRFS